MNLTSHAIKAAVAAYWRYTRQCSMVAFECSTHLRGGELADVLVVTQARHLILTEVKVSLGDLKRDKRKTYHKALLFNMQHPQERVVLETATLFPWDRQPIQIMPAVEYFYFAVPQDLANKVSLLCDQIYPYAGVLGCCGIQDDDIEVHRKPTRLQCSPLNEDQLIDITRAQTATLCRLARKVGEQDQALRGLQSTIKEYRDKERLEEVKAHV